jgi:predicted SnoaL-like aldol condensation-catalyzing enzyme
VVELKDFQGITAKIAQNLSNQGLVTQLLTQLNDDYSQESTTKATLLEQTAKHEATVTELQKANMNLFLKVGNPTPDRVIQTEKTLSYEDLVESMGGTK